VRVGGAAWVVPTGELLPEAPPRRQDEERLHRDVVKFLGWALPPDAVFYHPANGGLRSKKAADRLKGMGVVAGIPDLAIVHRGRALFIELKTATGRLSPAQREMQRRLIYAGAAVCLCRSVAEVEASLLEAAVHLRARVAA
jgi:hypothetical protein